MLYRWRWGLHSQIIFTKTMAQERQPANDLNFTIVGLHTSSNYLRFVEPELAAIWEYIALDNLDAADEVIEAIHTTMVELSRMPEMGRRCRFAASRLVNLRSFGVKEFNNYIIVCNPIAGGIEVFHVLHGARDIDALFGEQ